MSTRGLRAGVTCVVLLALSMLAAAASASAAPHRATTPTAAGRPAPLLVVAVPDLRWSDLADMPRLRALASQAAVGELSVKSLAHATRCANGLLALSAGERVDAGGTSCNIGDATRADLRRSNLAGRYGADIGALGQALRAAGLSTAAVGRAATLVIGDEQGRVDVIAPDVATAMRHADVTAVVLPAIYTASADGRRAAARATDAQLGTMLDAVPPGARVAVVGPTDGAVGLPRLHVVVLAGRPWGTGRLTSVHRLPYVQLTDLAPTFLAAMGVAAPPGMDGQVAETTAGAVPSPQALADDDLHARLGTKLGGLVRLILWFTVVGLALMAIGARWWQPFVWPVRVLGWPVAFAPAMSFLVQLLPWWRWGSTAYLFVVAGFSAVAGAIGYAVSRRLPIAGAGVLVPAAFTFAVLVVDQLAGARLQLSAPLGDSPLIAGRFRGMGNTDFALMATSALLVASVLATHLLRRDRRAAALGVVIGIGLLAVLVDGLPMLGDDFGGLLALLPVFGLLAATVAGVRLTPRRVLLGVVAVGVAVLLLALVDYLRPAAHQTHIGRFVGQLRHGSGGRVIGRKLAASLRSLGNAPAIIVVVVTATTIWVQRDRLFPGEPEPMLAPGTAVCLAGLAFLGSALNDSGITVASAVALASMPLLIAGLPATPARRSRQSEPAAP